MKRLIPFLALAVIGVSAVAQGNAVTFGGRTLLYIHESAGGRTAGERVRSVEERLLTILGFTNIAAKDVMAKPMGTDYGIYVKGKLLVTATQADAKRCQWTLPQFAEHWRKMVAAELPHMHLLPEQVDADNPNHAKAPPVRNRPKTGAGRAGASTATED